MNTRHAFVLICAAVLLTTPNLAGCSTTALQDGAGSTDASAEETGPITATGFIEAEEVNVVAETGGRVEQVLVDEGDVVTAGQLVVALDDTLLQADRLQAVAAVAVAEANLLQVQEGPRQEEIAAAQAAIDEAQAALQGAKNLSGQAWTTVANPRDIDVQIAAAQLEIDQFSAQVDDLEALLAEKQKEMDIIWHEDPQDETRIEFLRYEMELIRAQITAAQAQYNGALSKLNLLQLQRERPLSLIAQARAAQAQIPVAEARVELAQAQYEVLVAPARPEEIAIAQAQVDLAEAQVALIDAQIARLALVAPIDGVVTARSIAAGETASAGVPLLTIADLATLKLVVYIPETQIGRVRLGAPVRITVDAYPGRTFDGQVVAIGREAEFTPRNVQTEEERVNLVFAVEIVIDNTDGMLKAGMPADATIETAD